mmetsp:Transcript_26066/g.59940  ORF Transcript_26066/g.59940 Transcript_26066/m.59940 type:complete len:116 (-) Transcript_26066:66-413(-)
MEIIMMHILFFSLKQTLRGVDNDGKYLIERLADNINDYLDHYMTPCLTDMTKVAYNVVGGLMQQTHWIRMDGCKEVSCVFVGAQWDGAKCVAVSATDNMDYVVDQYCPPKLSPYP